MDELINVVAQKTGLSPEMARSAVEAVLGFVKDKLPEPMQGMIAGLIGGNTGDANSGGGDLAGQAMGALGGMFGGDNQ